MRKLLSIQIVALIVISGSLGGVLFFTDAYDEVYTKLISVICLSCIKLDSVNSLDFTFDTANGKDNPGFIKDLLDKGPVFIAFRTDVCEYCDYMEPIIKQIFGVDFEKEDVFAITVNINGTEMTFIHVNNDWAQGNFDGLQSYYDIAGDGAVPMFTTITLGYHHGFVNPIYNTVYGILDKDYSDAQRINLLEGLIHDAIGLYKDNRPGYTHD